MRYGSVCSGIEAASSAWHQLGWTPAFFAEIEPAPSAVLAHHYPEIRNLGDFTTIGEEHGPIDVLVGGTPCQSFSVAGLRKGLGDDRGNLALEFLRLADRLRPEWLVWENVPGVFSSLSHDAPNPRPPDIDLDGDDGPADGEEVVVEDEYECDEVHAFACFLAGLSELGYGFAYRVLDAQHAGVPQRRRRVFVVGYSGDRGGLAGPPSGEGLARFSRISAAVLLERHSLSGDPPPCREAGTRDPVAIVKGAAIGRQPHNGPQYGEFLEDNTCHTLNCTEVHAVVRPYNIIGLGQQGRNHAYPTETSGCLQHKGLSASGNEAGTLIHQPVIAFTSKDHTQDAGFLSPTLRGMSGQHANAGGQVAVATQSAVRRLTPVECERLQGFPDDHTLVPFRGKLTADGNRYKAVGNSMAVPVMRWIGERIQMVDDILRDVRP